MDRSQFENFMGKCEVSEGTLGNSCTILRDTESNQMVLMKEIEIYSNDEFKTMRSTLLKQKELFHEHLLSLIGTWCLMQTSMPAPTSTPS
jgi:hypothetical protein